VWTSSFLAKLIGPVLAVIGVGMLLDRPGYRAMAQEFLASRALIYVAGLLALVPGLAIVLTHNVWAADWRILITLLGWLAAAGGVFRILCPQQVTRIGNAMLAREQYLTISGAVMLALGAILCFTGYLR
jgi:uncharacterized membrane protein